MSHDVRDEGVPLLGVEAQEVAPLSQKKVRTIAALSVIYFQVSGGIAGSE